jgi:hypothetical protein
MGLLYLYLYPFEKCGVFYMMKQAAQTVNLVPLRKVGRIPQIIKRLLQKILRIQVDVATGEWKQLFNRQRHSDQSLPSIFRVK